jgi:glycosyltransferase involved in cell wall biosynthesis
MKILFLSRWFPYPADNGSKLRIYNLLRGLKRRHDATLLSFSDQPQGESEARELRSLCSEVHVVAWREFDPRRARAKLGFLSLKPRSLVDTFSSEMAGKISNLLGERHFDLVIASQLPMAAYAPYFKDLPAIFEELEIGLSLPDSNRPAGWRERLRRRAGWFKHRGYLSRLLKNFRAVTVVSDAEKELALRNVRNAPKVAVIPNCLNMDEYRDVRAQPMPNTLIFSGSFRYRVNYEAMQWFVAEVFPLVLDKLPSANLIVTGDHAGLSLPSRRNVTLAGHVDDIRSLIASSTVALAPLWSGGGTRLKILESLALGTPVVSTHKGAEGLDVVHGKSALLADDPVEFANSVIRVLENSELRRNLSEAGRRLVGERYSFEGMSAAFEDLLQSIASL